MDSSYYPFIYNLIVGLLVEIINASHPYSALTVQTLNVFSLFDFVLFAWLFHNWGLFNHNKKKFLMIVCAFGVAWLVITFFINKFSNINNSFLLIYSFALIFFSVTTFNKIVVQQRINIFTNARFWICMGIIIFYTFFMLTRATDLSGGLLNLSKPFKNNLQKIVAYSNLLVNLLYAVAVIWIPRKKNITSLL
jgi:hypothetical protein